ncbi:hypothetical protein ACFFRR_005550 [Megaselia abdita]
MESKTFANILSEIRADPKYKDYLDKGWYRKPKLVLINYIKELNDRIESETFLSNFNLTDSEKTVKSAKSEEVENYDFEIPYVKKYFNGRVVDIIFNDEEEFDLNIHLNNIKSKAVKYIFENIIDKKGKDIKFLDFKISLAIKLCVVKKTIIDGEVTEEIEDFYIWSGTHIINKENYSDIFKKMISEIIHNFTEQIIKNNSKYTLKNIIHTLKIFINHYQVVNI